MTEQYYKWYSHNLGMDMEMMVFGDRGYPVVLFPTTMGRYFECKDQGLIKSAEWFINEGLVQIYCPNSVNEHSWYNRQIHPADKVRNHTYYDKMVLEEIVDKIRWNTGTGKVAMAGPSFGAYQALNFAFRHPDRVSHLFAMSGKFDIGSFMDGYHDDNVYFNNPIEYIHGLNDPNIWNMNIVLGTSEWDICLEFSQDMSRRLNEKNINHWLDIRGWKEHDWPLWQEMFPHYLSLIHK
ncbi:MAG: alpha/beta fold hydrolase [Bacteroidota bacterium]